jgi:hypothetical protein
MEDALHNLLSQQGFLFRILGSLFATVTGSWQLYPLGFLFGLGLIRQARSDYWMIRQDFFGVVKNYTRKPRWN